MDWVKVEFGAVWHAFAGEVGGRITVGCGTDILAQALNARQDFVWRKRAPKKAERCRRCAKFLAAD